MKFPALVAMSLIYVLAGTAHYGKIKCIDYVTGRFYPAMHKDFVSLEHMGIPTRGRRIYLRIEAAQSLQRLYRDFKKIHPSVPFWVQSGSRNFYDQKYIWEAKWTGKRAVLGKRLNVIIKDPLKRAIEILKYSSMPGTSRHHWGTDFDINILTNAYYRNGEGLIIYRWMLKNAHRYGFCQPYTSGRKSGYSEERWHWSYIPLAKIYHRDWNRVYNENKDFFKRKGLFLGSEAAGHLAPVYVNSINESCK